MSDVTVLLDGIVKTTRDSTFGPSTVTSFSLGGEAYANATVDAAVRAFRQLHDAPSDELIESLIGKPVTMLCSNSGVFGAGAIITREGKFRHHPRGLGFFPKGNTVNGFLVDPAKILGVLPGYRQSDVFAKQVGAVRQLVVPAIDELTDDALRALPDRGERISMAVFGTLPFIAGERIPGCVWLIHSYMAEDDIVEGWLIVPPSQACSEHGSVYGKDLKRFGGKLVAPVDMSLEEAAELCDLPYEQVIERLTKVAVPA